MAHVLSPSPNSPLISTVGSDAQRRSSCSAASGFSDITVQHHRLRSISTNSLSSIGSYFSPPSRRPATQDRELTPPRPASSINLNFGKTRSTFLDRHSTSANDSRRTSLKSSGPSGRQLRDSALESERVPLTLIGVSEDHDPNDQLRTSYESPPIAPLPDSDDESDEEHFGGRFALHHSNLGTEIVDEADSPTKSESMKEPAFKRWVNKLKHKRHPHPPCTSPRVERWTLDDFDRKPTISPLKQRRASAHHKSDSQSSSMRFITSIRSATATIASASIATVSRRTSKWRRGQQRSSILSGSEPRMSADSTRSMIDEAAGQRSRKRREKLEELIRTEESYVADIKALSNTYFTILGHQTTPTSFARSAAQRVIEEILHLHDDILGQLHKVVPFAESDQSTARTRMTAVPRTHNRWHSVDIVPPRSTPARTVLATIRQGRRSLNISRSEEGDNVVLPCSPQVVAAATNVFAKQIARFAAYEEFGANYDLVLRDIDEVQQRIETWSDFDKAIEALSLHVNPLRSREANRKRAMAVKDLLIKPIQRMPRYELLFSELSKLTPVCDDPDAHAAIHELQIQLNGICVRTNAAKDSVSRARELEASWLICDRLSFSGQLPKSVFLQLLGPMTLCGCLYIAWRGKDRIKGRYVICLLFETTLLLATEEDDRSTYNIIAGIALANATVQETDNQKGLQCHTAPHSWKVVFEHAARMYELIMTACSAIEAEVWRTHIGTGISTQSQAVANGKANVFELQSPLTLEMKTIGKAFGKPGSFVRRMSVHRTATVGPSADLNQVIIKNTQAMKEVQDNASQTSLQIPRSQSLATPSHIQTLAPRRAERHRLESILMDVWSKDLLPYPGMVRRSDPIRAGANHVIRKFSMASITSNFSSSKRTLSYTSVNSWRKEDFAPSRGTKSSRHDSFTTSSSSRHTRSALPVSFHTNPEGFLPADFELPHPAVAKKKSTLRTLTMTMERPFSPLLGNEASRQSTLRRAQSVCDASEDSKATAFAPSLVPPLSLLQKEEAKKIDSVFSVVQERSKTPVSFTKKKEAEGGENGAAKTPRKSRSRFLRLFH